MRFLWKENFRYTQDKKLIAAVGAGNIGPDTNVYTDGGLVREGVQGESLDGDFSTGRGGGLATLESRLALGRSLTKAVAR